jgi:hypothetical protein
MCFSKKPDSTKKSFAAALLTVLLILALAGSLLVNVANANPMLDMGTVRPKTTTTPPEVFILSPQNGAKCDSPTIKVTYGVSPIHGPTIVSSNLIEVYYTASWLRSKVYVFKDLPYGFVWEEFSDTFEIEGVPQGVNSLTVTAVYFGQYVPYTTSGTYAKFTISGSSTVTFAVDLKPLRIGILAPYPQAYAASDMALTFTTNEETSRLQYCLDGQDNVTIMGNATLAGLAVGSHNVTVYGWDEFGNPGASETVAFTVAEPEPEAFPTSQLIAASSVASAAAIAFGLLAYFTKFKKRIH